MSTIAYAQMTNIRDSAAPGTSTTTGAPGVKTYVDAFAALVPAEVLTLHAIVISITTETAHKSPTNSERVEFVTTILPQAVGTLEVTFWILVAMSVALYAVPRYFGGKWDRFDWIRMLISPLAFVGWTMLQRTTAFDAAFPMVEAVPRTVTALMLGAVLGAISAGLAVKADAKQ